MQLHDNTIRVSGVVTEPRTGQQNPRRVSDRFGVARVEISSAKGRAWMDVVGNGPIVQAIDSGRLVPGTAVNIEGRLDSHKSGDRWSVRIWADALELPEQSAPTLTSKGGQ